MLVGIGKCYDYFTLCLLFVQKGEQVILFLGDLVFVKYEIIFGISCFGEFVYDFVIGGGVYQFGGLIMYGIVGSGFFVLFVYNLYVDFVDVIVFIIEVLCFVFQLQCKYERDVCFGTCYIEYLLVYWGVNNGDVRLQCLEYFGGGFQCMDF